MIAPYPDLPQAFAEARQHFLEAGRDDLAAWAALELAGYPPASPVPAYRTVPAQARGKLGNNDDEVVEDYPLPVWHLAGDWAHEDLRAPLSELMAASAAGDTGVRQAIAPDTLPLLTRGLRLGNGARVTAAWWQVEPAALVTLLDAVRTRLRLALEELAASRQAP